MIEHTYFQDVDMPTLVVGTHVDPFELKLIVYGKEVYNVLDSPNLLCA